MTEPDPFADLVDVAQDDTSTDNEASPQRTRRRRSDAGQPRGPRGTGGGRKPSTAKLVDELLVPYTQLSMALSMASPVAAGVLMARGEHTVKAMVQIAEKHPRLLAALRKGSQIAPSMDIAQTVVMTVVAVQVDRQTLDPHSPLAVSLGIEEVWNTIYGQPPTFNAQQVNNEWVVPAPPHQPSAYKMNDPRHPAYSFSAGVGAASMGPP